MNEKPFLVISSLLTPPGKENRKDIVREIDLGDFCCCVAPMKHQIQRIKGEASTESLKGRMLKISHLSLE